MLLPYRLSYSYLIALKVPNYTLSDCCLCLLVTKVTVLNHNCVCVQFVRAINEIIKNQQTASHFICIIIIIHNHNNSRFLFSRKEEKTDSMMHQLTSMLYVVLCSGNRCNCIVRNRPTALRAGSAARQQVGEILFGRIRVHCLLHRHESCQCRFQALSLLLQRLGRRMSYLINYIHRRSYLFSLPLCHLPLAEAV